MKSSLDILQALFEVLNVPQVTTGISGRLYIGDAPDTSQLEDITINSLTNKREGIQSGIVNLNIYIQQTKAGRANLRRFQEIVNVIIPLIEDVSLNGFHFQLFDDKWIFKDNDRSGLYFYNLKIDFQTL